MLTNDEEEKRFPPPLRIEPHYKMALKAANDSPCVRRKYGVVIIFDDRQLVSANNARVSSVCTKSTCVRDRAGVTNGSRTELGAEVHAEQAALVDAHKRGLIFILAGVGRDYKSLSYIELTGKNVYPCLVCARMIKYAGYKWVHHKNDGGDLVATHIEDIIKHRERELGPHYE